MKARLEPQIAQSLIDIINEYLSVDIRKQNPKAGDSKRKNDLL